MPLVTSWANGLLYDRNVCIYVLESCQLNYFKEINFPVNIISFLYAFLKRQVKTHFIIGQQNSYGVSILIYRYHWVLFACVLFALTSEGLWLGKGHLIAMIWKVKERKVSKAHCLFILSVLFLRTQNYILSYLLKQNNCFHFMWQIDMSVFGNGKQVNH